MDSALVRDVKEMILGVELTLVGGIALLFGAVANVSPIWGGGLVLSLFGFWVTADAYANGADPRSQNSGRNPVDSLDGSD